jgi:hypothetical protein
MRQNLTPEQVLSLKPEAQAALREWWRPRMANGDWFYGSYGYWQGNYDGDGYWCDTKCERRLKTWIISPYCVDSGVYGASLDDGRSAYPDSDALPLLSIGQCLQLLVDKGYPPLMCGLTQQGDWLISAHVKRYSRAAELIDALFAAVKAVLEVQS